jgi:hypothetical protein
MEVTRMKKGIVFLIMLSLAASLLIGCTSPAGPSATSDQPVENTTGTAAPAGSADETAASGYETDSSAFGTLAVKVTDAPKYGIVSVVVHFSEVKAHISADDPEGEGEWITLNIVEDEFDLVELGVDQIKALLAEADNAPVGHYTQLRVVIDQPVQVTYSNTNEEEETVEVTVDAKLPSGELKFVRAFDVLEDEITIICLDFIVEDMVNFTGANQKGTNGKTDLLKVIVKPVIKLSVEHQSQTEAEIETGTIDGTVSDGEGPLEGATVTLSAPDGFETLTANTDEDGYYQFDDVPVGSAYTVTAAMDGYQEASEADVEVIADTPTTVDFEMLTEQP